MLLTPAAGEKMIARAMPGVTLPAPEVPVCALAIGSAIGVMRSIIQVREGGLHFWMAC